MDELHKTAEAYYNVSTENIKKRANEFYRKMDQNDDGQVSLHEYLAFMKNQGYTSMSNPNFFKKLSKQGNDETYLTFLEVMTLFYIIESGRPFCDGCGDFINGMFFTCVECFESKRSTFNVCIGCFKGGNSVHNHKDFMDNFLLLESKRKVGGKGGESETKKKETTPAQSCNKCNEIVLANPRDQLDGLGHAFEALKAAVKFVGQSCTIM